MVHLGLNVFAYLANSTTFVTGNRVVEEGGGQLGAEVSVEKHAGRLRAVLHTLVQPLHGRQAVGPRKRTRLPFLSVKV